MNKCQAGCKVFYGGEIRHHKDCVFYPESFSKLYDDLNERYDALMGMTKTLIENQKDIPAEFQEILNNNYWDLITKSNENNHK